jgi:hypothetical protein
MHLLNVGLVFRRLFLGNFFLAAFFLATFLWQLFFGKQERFKDI